jgi:hypothetical protein
MNKIVREHYPASQLPKELRPSDDPNAKVTVTIEEEESRLPVAGHVGRARNIHGSPEEVISHIRSLREDR